MLDDRYNLERWSIRTAALGLVARPDLFALVAAQHDNKDELNKTLDKAIEAGKGTAGANMGTALHKACERVDLGDTSFTMPGDAARDLDAYRKLRASTGAVPHLLPDGRPGVEVIVIVPELNVAGTFDRLLEIPGELLPVIDDIKTGESAIEWGMASIAIQLSIYAHGTHIFDPATGQLTPMPRVNQSKAFVTHLPAGKGQAAMWEVDIAAGWEAAKIAAYVREYRTKAKRGDLVRHANATSAPAAVAASGDDPFDVFAGLPSAQGEGEPARGDANPAFSPSRPEPTVDPFDSFVSAPAPMAATVVHAAGNARVGAPAAPPADLFAKHVKPPADDPFAEFVVGARTPRQIRYDNIKRRLATLKGIEGAAERMVALWPEGMPPTTNKHFEQLDDDLDRIEGVLVEVEKQHGAPFDPPAVAPAEIPADPTPVARPATIDEGPLMDAADLEALKGALSKLDPAQHAWFNAIVKQCGEAHASINLRESPSTRRFGIARALLLAALANLDDTTVTLCARVVTGDEASPLGALIGRLSTAAAQRLGDLACAVEAGDIKVVTAQELATPHETVLSRIDPATAIAITGDLSPYKPPTITGVTTQ